MNRDHRHVCECGGGHVRLSHGEGGEVVNAAGERLCAIAADGSVVATEFEGTLLAPAVRGEVVTACEAPEGYSILAGGLQKTVVPSQGLMDFVYDPANCDLFILSVDSLVRISVDDWRVHILACDLAVGSPGGRYESILASKSLVVAFRYALGVFVDGVAVGERGEYAICSAAIVDRNSIVCADINGRVYSVSARGMVIAEIGRWDEEILSVAAVGDRVAVVARRGERELIGHSRQHGPWQHLVLGEFFAECHAVIPERGLLAMGTTDGHVLVWDPASNKCRPLDVAPVGNPRITSMLWSSRHRMLYCGTATGSVHALEIS